jgi:DNA-binding NarL/FixJ family response regulator
MSEQQTEIEPSVIKPISVILADDHSIVIDGLRAVLRRHAERINIVGTAANGNDLVELVARQQADVYVVDLAMPIMNGIETTLWLLKQDPENKVIILSMHDDHTLVEKALCSGAIGYVLKETATEDIVEAITSVYEGRPFLSEGIARFVSEDFYGKRSAYIKYERIIELTAKERQVLQLIAEGYSNREVAKRMDLSPNTIHVHRNNIMRKLNIHRQAELIRYAIKEGLTSL